MDNIGIQANELVFQFPDINDLFGKLETSFQDLINRSYEVDDLTMSDLRSFLVDCNHVSRYIVSSIAYAHGIKLAKKSIPDLLETITRVIPSDRYITDDFHTLHFEIVRHKAMTDDIVVDPTEICCIISRVQIAMNSLAIFAKTLRHLHQTARPLVAPPALSIGTGDVPPLSSMTVNSAPYIPRGMKPPHPTYSASRHKTELCKNYVGLGYCKMGNKCKFAHGERELKKPN